MARLNSTASPSVSEYSAIADHGQVELDGIAVGKRVFCFEHAAFDPPAAAERHYQVGGPSRGGHAPRSGGYLARCAAFAGGHLSADINLVLQLQASAMRSYLHARDLQAEPQYAAARGPLWNVCPADQVCRFETEFHDVGRYEACSFVLRPERRHELNGQLRAVIRTAGLVSQRGHRLCLVHDPESIALGSERQRAVVALAVFLANDHLTDSLPHQAQRTIFDLLPVRVEDDAVVAAEPSEACSHQ
jgi:hypothetical protein